MFDDLRIEGSADYEKAQQTGHANSAQPNGKTSGVNLITDSSTVNHETKLNSQTIEQAVNDTNDLMESFYKSYKFSYHEKTDRYQVSIINRDTGETLKEIPPEEILKLAEQLQESFSALVDKYS